MVETSELPFEFQLEDRIQKIQQIVRKVGQENCYLSFSGGKDSTVLHYLLDDAVPNNSIPRVFADTGIELQAIRDFVKSIQEKDGRIVMLKPEKTYEKY